MEKKEIGTMREKEFKDALQESREYLSDYNPVYIVRGENYE